MALAGGRFARRYDAFDATGHAVAAAGGWNDLTTLLECYQAPDVAAVLAVMAKPRKHHDQRAAERTTAQ